MLGQDLPAHGGGVGGGGGDGGAVGPHHFPAEGLLLVGDLDHVDLAVQAQIGAGHGEGRAPLTGAGLGGHALQALLLGVVGLGDGGVELVGAGGVVALELVVDLGRGLELFLQAVGPDQGGGTVHFIEVPDLFGDRDVGVVVVQFLLDQLLAEHALQLLGGHGLAGAGVEQRGGLVFHVGPDVVPCLGHLVFFQINLVGDLFVCSHVGSAPFYGSGTEGKTKNAPVPCSHLQGQKLVLLRCHPAWRVAVFTRPLSALYQVPTLGNGASCPSRLLKTICLVGSALPGPFVRGHSAALAPAAAR